MADAKMEQRIWEFAPVKEDKCFFNKKYLIKNIATAFRFSGSSAIESNII